MSNMNMNIKIQYSKDNQKFPSSHWVDKKKLNSYMLPSFTKKVVQYLEKIDEKGCNYWSWYFRVIYCQLI